MTGQETRNKLTDYWAGHDIKKGDEYVILTNIIHQEWAEVSVRAHMDLKGLQTQNLRDHMSEAELIFTALAELSTRQIAESVEAVGMPENSSAAKVGGRIAKKARLELEEKTGRKVVSGESYLPLSNMANPRYTLDMPNHVSLSGETVCEPPAIPVDQSNLFSAAQAAP